MLVQFVITMDYQISKQINGYSLHELSSQSLLRWYVDSLGFFHVSGKHKFAVISIAVTPVKSRSSGFVFTPLSLRPIAAHFFWDWFVGSLIFSTVFPINVNVSTGFQSLLLDCWILILRIFFCGYYWCLFRLCSMF